MKSSEYIIETIRELDKEMPEAHAELLNEFAAEHEEEIRFKVLEMWAEYLIERINKTQNG